MDRLGKYQFKVVYDNLVTDDLIQEVFNADTIEEADMIAWKHSKRTGLSEGNYQMFVKLNLTWIDVMYILELAERKEDAE